MFRRAVIALASEATNTEPARRHEEAAGDALVSLARSGQKALLAGLLRGDPASTAHTWTVACYQLGDLTPSALRDFADPVEAVVTLAGCDNPTHVAAELLVCTDGGLRWTALVREGTRITFHLLTSDTGSDAAHDAEVALSEAETRWEARLAEWARVDDESQDGEHGDLAETTGLRLEAVRDQLESIERRLGGIEEVLRILSDDQATTRIRGLVQESPAEQADADHLGV